MNIALSLNHKPDPGSIHKDPHHIYHIPLLLLLEQILDNFMKKGKIINRGNSWHWANFEFGLRKFEISWILHIMVCLYKKELLKLCIESTLLSCVEGIQHKKQKEKSKYLWGRSQITRSVMGGGGEGLKIIMIIKRFLNNYWNYLTWLHEK